MPIIVDHLNCIYEQGTNMEVAALKDINLVIPDGQFIGLIGHTGSGKSTLVQHLNGLIEATSGTVYFNGEDIYDKDYDRKKLRSKVGLVFQYPEHQLFETDVFKDVCFGPKNLGLDRKETELRAYKALKMVGLPDEYFYQSPFDLSGGQKRRVAIAGVLAMEPDVLILDEPTAGLDPKGRDEILELIKAMQKKYDLTTIYITHDLGVVANVADRIAVMYAGDIVELGTCDEVFYDPRHPYTWALLSSLPQLGTKDEPLYSIQGTPPNLFHEVKGDAFAPRNPKALKIDFVERPPFFEVTPTHYARTWLMDPRAPKVEPPEHVRILREKGVNRVG